MIEILHKTKNVVVIYKPSSIPSQKDLSNDKDAMTMASELLADMGENSELWLVHRLDRVVGGLLIFARNKKYASILSEAVKERIVTKEYYAIVDGEAPGGELCDLIYKDSRTSKAFIVDRARAGVKEARLSYRTLAVKNTDKGAKSLLYIALDTGRFHQIRAQLSHRRLPISGDGKYGSKDNKVKGIALMAAHLSVDQGVERADVFRLPNRDEYPWSLFSEEEYRL